MEFTEEDFYNRLLLAYEQKQFEFLTINWRTIPSHIRLEIMIRAFRDGEKDFISKLSKIVPNVKPRYSDKEIMITCGIKNNITIMFNEQKTIVFIDNTNIIYQYIYGYKDDDVTKYDHKGISKIPTERFYNLLIKRISDLVDKEYQYIEYYQGNDYNGCLLKHNDKEIYNIIINEKKNIFKRNKSKKRIINT